MCACPSAPTSLVPSPHMSTVSPAPRSAGHIQSIHVLLSGAPKREAQARCSQEGGAGGTVCVGGYDVPLSLSAVTMASFCTGDVRAKIMIRPSSLRTSASPAELPAVA